MHSTDALNTATRVLIVFARDGFEKATMSQLAEAAGVSRQTLYNRHGTRENILAWMAEVFSRHARMRACEALGDPERPAVDCLVTAFSERMGVLVPLVHGLPHGPEILDLATRLRREHQADFPAFHADFTKDLTLFLQARGVCGSLAEAEETVFLLMMAGKGLLMDTRSRAAFEAGMARIAAVVLGDPAESRAAPESTEDDPESFPARARRQTRRPAEEEPEQ